MRLLFLSLVGGLLMIAGPANAKDVPVSDLLIEMKDALLKVQQASEAEKLPPLQEARLNISTVHKRETGGTFKFLIFEFGKKRTKEITTSMSIALAPPPANSSSNVSSADISDLMASAILTTARALAVADDGEPPLITKEVKATIKFGVTKEASGKLKIELVPIEVGGGGSGSRADVQEMVLTYAVPSKK